MTTNEKPNFDKLVPIISHYLKEKSCWDQIVEGVLIKWYTCFLLTQYNLFVGVAVFWFNIKLIFFNWHLDIFYKDDGSDCFRKKYTNTDVSFYFSLSVIYPTFFLFVDLLDTFQCKRWQNCFGFPFKKLILIYGFRFQCIEKWSNVILKTI